MDTRVLWSWVFAVCTVLFLIGVEEARAGRGGGGGGRGGGGGGRSGGGRSGGGRSGGGRYSSRGRSSGRSGASKSGSRGKSSSGRWKSSRYDWDVDLSHNTFYGSQSYVARRMYKNGEPPQICQNWAKLNENGSVYGWFICPLGDLGDEYTYCCGELLEQECCTFFGSPARTAGAVFGILISFCVLGLLIYFFWVCYLHQTECGSSMRKRFQHKCDKRRKKGRHEDGIHNGIDPESVDTQPLRPLQDPQPAMPT